jgi:hypothetical protein
MPTPPITFLLSALGWYFKKNNAWRGESWGNSKVALAKVDKDGDLKNGLRFEMDKLNMVVMKEVVEEIAGREFKSSLKKVINTTISLVWGVGITSFFAGSDPCRPDHSSRDLWDLRKLPH